MKKKLVALLTNISILTGISATVFAGPGSGISVPPEPIRDSVEVTK